MRYSRQPPDHAKTPASAGAGAEDQELGRWACGEAGGTHAPGCAATGTRMLSLAERLDEITGVGLVNARVIIAELGTDPSTFPTPGHAAAWVRLTPRTLQSGNTARPGRTGKGDS